MADVKIFKSFSAVKNDDQFKSTFGQGVISLIDWNQIKDMFNENLMKGVGEEIEGIKVDDKGIHVKFVKRCK